ncbi:uncharacterized protein LOC122390731 isoform X1 [Amphibalanus amphitrite]|uniref:uncharacterized protein LOC122390731 isoform X1 n=1 Tax=Amphibalanus amphitrite TaxID=1232801 RepID=UPI001C9169A3|nr:uncharacterized protein LOC122390731 isoform X1 [Amphibalanus amphitrite]
MGIKSKAKARVKELKKVKSKLKEGAAAIAGIETKDDEESIAERKEDKAEGELGKLVKKGNGVPKLMMSEPGRQAFWFLIMLISLVSCQAGLAFSFLGATLRPALDNHHVLLDHFGQNQAILNVGKAGSLIVVVGLMMVKGSAFQLVAALLARQKRKSRRRCAVKFAFGCVLFELLVIVFVCIVAALFFFWLRQFHETYRDTLPRALVKGYLQNTTITAYVNWLQYRFQCCGVTDFKDWFIADWQPRKWLANRYPTVLYYRDTYYATGKKVERYPDWRDMSLMSNYEKSWETRLTYLQDRVKKLVGDGLIDEYVATTSFAEVPFSCCRPDAASTWCVRQYLVFKLYAYDFKTNSTIFKRGCPKQVEAFLNGRLSGVGVALLVLMGVRVLNLLMLRLVQTSTSNALLARRHLSEAHGWLFTTRRARATGSSDEERHLLADEIISDLTPSDEDSQEDEDGVTSETSDGDGESGSAASGTTEPSDGDGTTETTGEGTSETTADGPTETTGDGQTETTADGETTDDLTEITTLLAPSDVS